MRLTGYRADGGFHAAMLGGLDYFGPFVVSLCGFFCQNGDIAATSLVGAANYATRYLHRLTYSPVPIGRVTF